VDSVERFQRGEELAHDAPVEEEAKAVTSKPPASVPEKAATSTTKTKPVTPAPAKQTSLPSKATAKKVVPVKTAPKKNAQPATKLTSLSSSSSAAKLKAAQAVQENDAALQQKESQPEQRGKAKFECGCFGNLHKALANCLHCGRISCKKEGYDFCPCCGYLVKPVVPPAEGMYVPRNQTDYRLASHCHSLYLSVSSLTFPFFIAAFRVACC
jgi:hypothetical protein